MTSVDVLHPVKQTRPGPWEPDECHIICQNCSKSFGITRRRHHCRKCGSVVCSDCSKNRSIVEGYGSSAQRTCNNCMAKIYANAEKLRIQKEKEETARLAAEEEKREIAALSQGKKKKKKKKSDN